MANPGPAQAGIPNTELYLSNGPMSRVIYPVGFTNGNAIGNGTLSFQYYNCTYPVSASRLDCLLEMSQATAATTATAAALVTAIGGIYQTAVSTNTAGTTNYINLLSARLCDLFMDVGLKLCRFHPVLGCCDQTFVGPNRDQHAAG